MLKSPENAPDTETRKARRHAMRLLNFELEDCIVRDVVILRELFGTGVAGSTNPTGVFWSSDS